MSALVVTPTAKTIGAEVTGIQPDDLLKDESIVTTVMEALEANGVLVFRDLNLDPETQVAFCQRIGEVDYLGGSPPRTRASTESLETPPRVQRRNI